MAITKNRTRTTSNSPRIKIIKKGAEKRVYDDYIKDTIQSPKQEQNHTQNSNSFKLIPNNLNSDANSNSNSWNNRQDFSSDDGKTNNTPSFPIPNGVMQPENSPFQKMALPPDIKARMQYAETKVGGMVRQGVFMPVQHTKKTANSATANGMQQSNELRTLQNYGTITGAVAIDLLMNHANKTVLSDIRHGVIDSISIDAINDTHKILYDNQITWQKNFSLKTGKDIEELREGINLYAHKIGLGSLSNMSKEQIDSKILRIEEQIEKIKSGKVNITNPEELKKLYEQKQILETAGQINQTGKKYNVFRNNRRNIKHRIKRFVVEPVRQTEFYRGYSTVTQAKLAYTGLAKAVLLEGKGIWRINRIALGKSSALLQRMLMATGSRDLITTAQGIRSVTQGVGRIADLGERGVSTVLSTPKTIRKSVKTTSLYTKNRIKYASSKLKTTKQYKKVRRWARKSSVGKNIRKVKATTRGSLRFIKRTKPIKTISRGTGLIANKFRQIRQIFRSFMSVIKSLLLKATCAVGGLIVGTVIVSSTVIVMISAISTIGDAVSNSFDEFKTKTTMGQAYSALLKKEEEFNQAVSTLADKLTAPSDDVYKDKGITKYTNVNVHYIGADGKEMSWSGAIGNFDIDPNEVSDTIWKYMKRKGWNNIAIAGLLGNIQQESAFNIAAKENGRDDGSATVLGSGFGLCQWTNTGGNSHGRRYNLFQYATKKGKEVTSIELQLDFILYGEGSDSVTAREYGKKNFSSVAEATEYFCMKWERPNVAMAHLNDVRIPAAQNFYEHYTSNSEFADIDADLEHVGDNETDTSGDSEIAMANVSATNTSTIKGILSMAAIYIDQDFKKYGKDWTSTSLYKDYCAKLYDSSHIIGIDETPPTIYYCPAVSANETEPQYHVASTGCNNLKKAGSSEADYLSGNYGIYVTKEKDTYTNKRDKEVTYDKYTVEHSGPHGTVTYDAKDNEDYKEASETMKERGCKSFTSFVISRSSDSLIKTLVCKDPECMGHIDAEAYVFVSNIYDPSESNTSDDTSDNTTPTEDEGDAGESADNGNTAEETKTSSKDLDKSFENIEKTGQEYKYSMYVLDKYATAFDKPGSDYVYCTNPSCSHYKANNVAENDETATPIEITDGSIACPECGTILYAKKGRTGDQESVTAADETEKYSAEKAIMEDLTSHSIKIVEWWNNENWFTDQFTTKKTYFRLSNLEDSIDTLKTPESGEDKNVINSSNSNPYWFNSFTNSGERNVSFEKHGWDSDSIMRTRLLMASDWTELYGIKDFGYIQGSPMTNAQISQLIANNPSWESLCDDRKVIIANAILFNKEANRLNITYHQSTPIIRTMAQLQAAQSMTQVTNTDCANKHDGGRGFDCSSYIGFILYNSGLYGTARPSTSAIAGQIGSVFEVISAEEAKPGDIALSSSHVVLYMGGGKVSEAAGHGQKLADTFNHSKPSIMSGSYRFLRLKNIDENKHTINLTSLTGGTSSNSESENTEN